MTSYPHEPVEVLLARIQQANTPDQPKKILILGAGIAGLTAAHELNNLGHDVQVIEAQSRVGGRIYTYRFPEDPDHLYGEMGAMRLPASHDYPLYYIEKMGLKLRRFVTVFENDNAFLDLRGHVAQIKDGQRLVDELYDITHFEQQNFPQSQLLGMKLQSYYARMTDEQVRKLFEGDLSDPFLQEIANTSLSQLLEESSTGTDAFELVGNLSGEIGMGDVSMIKYLRDYIEGADIGLTEIVGGMDLLPRSLADTLGGRIHLNTEVRAIDSTTNGGVAVEVKNADGVMETLEADHVICTIPFTVLRRMQLKLHDPQKAFAINTLNYAAMTKVVLNCRERFWESKYHIFGGASVSDGITRWTYYPSDHADHTQHTPPSDQRLRGISGNSFHVGQVAPPTDRPDNPGPGVLLAAYIQGEDAVRISAIDDEEVVRVVKEGIARFHPEIMEEGMVTGSYVMAWDRFPWSAGALSYPWPGQPITLSDDIIEPDGNLHFAGEHCATERPWIQGAMKSSLQAVLHILEGN